MKRHLFALSLVLFALIGLAASAASTPVLAQEELSVCADLNSPDVDSFWWYLYWDPGWALHRGEVLTFTAGSPAGEPIPDTIYLYLDGEEVEVPYPGTLTYTVQADHVITETLVVGAWSNQANDFVPVTWQGSCTFASPAALPGCDVTMNMPSGSVVGAFVANAPVYSAPGVLVSPAVTLQAGKTAWVLGVDATGQYFKIVWVCDYLWVPVGTMGPNPDAVWRNTPLPTKVVK